MVARVRTYIILAAMVLLASCQKELCMDHHHDGMKVRVIFDWTNADPDPTTVKGMTLLLYPEDGGAPLRYPFSDIKGGVISITSGNYRALCVNDDELLQLVNADSWETVSVTTGETSILSRADFNDTRADIPQSESSSAERVLREPPLLYSDTCNTFYIRATEEEQVLRMYPQMLLGRMHIRFENVENLEYLVSMSAAISNLSSSLNLSTQQPSESHCTMPINLYVTDDGAIEGYLYYFGHCPSEQMIHELTLYTMLIDTSKQASIFDVTDQIHDDDSGGGGEGGDDDEDKDVEITIPSLPLPTPQPAEGGFNLKLDEWTINTIDIKM